MNTQNLLDPKSWAERTFGGVQLHDRRRTRRAVKAATDLAENPLGSLPAQMHTWKETKALYRLRGSSQTSPRLALMQPHLQETREQAQSSPVVLLVQETTDIDLSHRHKISFVQTNRQRTRTGIFRANGAGGASSDPRGAGMHGEGHPLCAFLLPRENGEINGASERSAKPMSGCARCTPLARLSREASGCMWEIGGPICSRSAEACQATQTHFLVRAGKSRRVQESEEEISSELPQARAFPSQASRAFEVPARHGRQARSTQLQLAFGQLTLLPPRQEPRASK